MLSLNGSANGNGAVPVAVAFSRIYFEKMDLVKRIRDKDLYITVSTDTCTFTHNDPRQQKHK